ncbi:MAG: tetratricopeptide repeat protein, partial [Bauldia sp.]
YEQIGYERVIAAYARLIELQPNDASAYVNRGHVHGDNSHTDLAVADYTQAIELEPDNAEIYSFRGAMYQLNRDYDRAIADYARLIELRPDDASAYNARGNSYGEKGDYDRAIADFSKAIELKPDFAEAYSQRGLAAALAASPLVAEVQRHLYAGRTAEAAAAVERRLAAAPDDDQARFALGAVQFLQAVENVGRSFYQFGLRGGQYGIGLIDLPILRIPVPHNPNPYELTYEGLRDILASFVSDLDTAEKTLAMVGPGQIGLPLDIGQIRLDLDGDGEGSDDEALWRIFAAVSGARGLDGDTPPKLLAGFDQSDVPWLQAYCHLLMGIAEFPLAYDWETAFDITFPGIFPMPSSPYAKLHAAASEFEQLVEQLLKLPEQEREKYMEDHPDQFEEMGRPSEIAGIADLIAFIHLNRWPLVEPERMRSAARNLEAMIGFSRENWRRILAETDDRAEWVPSPSQTGIFPGFRVDADRIAGWRGFLDEFEAILQGKKLIPHWRFDDGINMRKLFDEPPQTFDIVLLIAGAAALPYLEAGEMTTAGTWTQITQVFGGDFFRYFIWFN